MDKFSVSYSGEALDDLRNIYEYIAFQLNSPVTAVAQVNRIRSAARSLKAFPKRNKLVDWMPWSKLNVRQLPVDHFMTFYLADGETLNVTILRIFYGKRDIPHLIAKER